MSSSLIVEKKKIAKGFECLCFFKQDDDNRKK